MLVGLHSDTTSGHYPDGRTRDYLPEIDLLRFDAHLAFAVAEPLRGRGHAGGQPRTRTRNVT
ncbi:hypothetical protein EDD27_2945 [Nonomuraea polychroma]|uniref:Uncharacterized protein n=2 Tax=Nonomuraea polychroma TaxID=46176 RepID=A0A438M3Y7_9ACTN|nr:hypothetical protein EDD27_2945 [Nonomuraea polychroma]